MGELKPPTPLRRIIASTLSSFKNWKRAGATFTTSLMFYSLFAFNTNLPWNLEILRTGNWLQILDYGTASLLASGILGFSLTAFYSVVAGVTVVVTVVTLKTNGLELSGIGSTAPGFLAAGCSCGLGIAGILGMAGVTSALPFQGNLIKLLGVSLMLYALAELGKSEKCDININYRS